MPSRWLTSLGVGRECNPGWPGSVSSWLAGNKFCLEGLSTIWYPFITRFGRACRQSRRQSRSSRKAPGWRKNGAQREAWKIHTAKMAGELSWESADEAGDGGVVGAGIYSGGMVGGGDASLSSSGRPSARDVRMACWYCRDGRFLRGQPPQHSVMRGGLLRDTAMLPASCRKDFVFLPLPAQHCSSHASSMHGWCGQKLFRRAEFSSDTMQFLLHTYQLPIHIYQLQYFPRINPVTSYQRMSFWWEWSEICPSTPCMALACMVRQLAGKLQAITGRYMQGGRQNIHAERLSDAFEKMSDRYV